MTLINTKSRAGKGRGADRAPLALPGAAALLSTASLYLVPAPVAARAQEKPPAVVTPVTDKAAEALIAAIQANDPAKVKTLLAKSAAAVNTRDGNRSTPLMQACAAAGVEVVQALLEAGADIEATDKDGFTPLMVSAYSGKIPVAQFLLEKGANVNARDARGRTALMGAAYSGRTGIVELFLDKGADIKAKDDEDFTALMVAAGAANAANVRLLLDRGAPTDSPTKTGFTPLMQACGAKYDTIARQREQGEILKLLLERGANVNTIALRGSTALLVAAYAGNAEAVRLLLEQGAQIEAVDAVGHTPLIGAAYAGNVEAVRHLLNRGARLETKTKTGFTALMQAAYSGRLEAAKALLGRNADVHAATNQGITPLMQAAGTGNQDMMRLLLEHGSDINSRDVKGQNAAYWAIKRGHDEVLPLLVRAGAEVKGLAGVPADTTKLAAKVPMGTSAEAVRKLIGSLPARNPAPAIHGPRIVGASPGRPFLFRIPATGQGTLTFSASGLPSGLTLDHKTGILTGKIATPGTYTVTVAAAGAAGKATGRLKIVCEKGKLALTPPMGWSAWNLYGETVTGDLVRKQTDWLVKSGLAAHGYQYILLDDTWQGRRETDTGELIANRRLGDIAALADYVHARGLKLGIYSSPNEETCAGYTGSLGHEEQDAKTFASWGVDYLKYDWCDPQSRRGDTTSEMLKTAFAKMRAALDKTDRDIVYSVNPYAFGRASDWGREVGANSWWTVSQLNETWESVSRSGFDVAFKADDAGQGHWNDLGWLYIGKVGSATINPHFTRLTPDEQKAQFSLWCLQAAPLILSCDLTQLDPNAFFPITTAILTNEEVIAVDQDALGKPAQPVEGSNNSIWSRPLADGTVAVGLFNRRGGGTMTVRWSEIGLSGAQPVRDLWRRTDLGLQTDEFTVTVPFHGVVLIKVGKPKE